jgi:hypothetical protein
MPWGVEQRLLVGVSPTPIASVCFHGAGSGVMPVDPHEQIRRSKPSRSRGAEKNPISTTQHCRAGALMAGQKPAHLERVRRISKQCKGIETPSQTKFLKNDQRSKFPIRRRVSIPCSGRSTSRIASLGPAHRPTPALPLHPRRGGRPRDHGIPPDRFSHHLVDFPITGLAQVALEGRRSRAGRSSPWSWPLPDLWAWRAIGSWRAGPGSAAGSRDRRGPATRRSRRPRAARRLVRRDRSV